jgi:hypothetical protein
LAGDALVENTDNNTHAISVNFSATSGTSYTTSIYVKSNGRDVVLEYGSAFGATQRVSFDLAAKTATTSAGTATGTVQDVGNGWLRVSMTAAATATATAPLAIYVSIGTTRSYQGDGTSGIFIWGAQLNTGAAPAAYLQTVATAVTTAYAAPIESPNGLAFPLLATMTPARNADMTFELASNTSLVVKVRGSDGTVRSATLTLA